MHRKEVPAVSSVLSMLVDPRQKAQANRATGALERPASCVVHHDVFAGTIEHTRNFVDIKLIVSGCAGPIFKMLQDGRKLSEPLGAAGADQVTREVGYAVLWIERLQVSYLATTSFFGG